MHNVSGDWLEGVAHFQSWEVHLRVYEGGHILACGMEVEAVAYLAR